MDTNHCNIFVWHLPFGAPMHSVSHSQHLEFNHCKCTICVHKCSSWYATHTHTHYSKMFGYVVASPFSPSSLFSPNFLLATLPGSQGPAPAQPGRKGQGKTARPKRATHPPADLHGKRAEAAGALDGIEVKDEESSDGWHEVKPKGRKQKK